MGLQELVPSPPGLSALHQQPFPSGGQPWSRPSAFCSFCCRGAQKGHVAGLAQLRGLSVGGSTASLRSAFHMQHHPVTGTGISASPGVAGAGVRATCTRWLPDTGHFPQPDSQRRRLQAGTMARASTGGSPFHQTADLGSWGASGSFLGVIAIWNLKPYQ